MLEQQQKNHIHPPHTRPVMTYYGFQHLAFYGWKQGDNKLSYSETWNPSPSSPSRLWLCLKSRSKCLQQRPASIWKGALLLFQMFFVKALLNNCNYCSTFTYQVLYWDLLVIVQISNCQFGCTLASYRCMFSTCASQRVLWGENQSSVVLLQARWSRPWHVLPVPVWFLSMFSRFLPPSKNTHVRGSGSLSWGVYVRANACLRWIESH